MSRGAYHEINLHITWHTKDNTRVLVDAVEAHTHRYLERRTRASDGVYFHIVNGIEDHIHQVVSVPPTLRISDWIGELKGASSFFINHEICNRKVLEWQPGYGVVSFGTKDLPWVIQYVKNQKEHHARGTTHVRLERINADDETSSSEKPVKTGLQEDGSGYPSPGPEGPG